MINAPMLPDEARVEQCIHELAETDERFAILKAAVGALEHGIKIAEAIGFLEATGTQENRKATARASGRYKAAVDSWENAKADFHLIEARRNKDVIEIDVWRSVNAGRRK
jgi:hypothetical protein